MSILSEQSEAFGDRFSTVKEGHSSPQTTVLPWGTETLNWSSSLIDIKFKKCRVAQGTQHALRVF